MDFSLMPQQTARVGEARVEFASGFVALVGSLVAVHVLVPFTDSLEGRVVAVVSTVGVVADDVAVFVAGKGSSSTQCSRHPA